MTTMAPKYYSKYLSEDIEFYSFNYNDYIYIYIYIYIQISEIYTYSYIFPIKKYLFTYLLNLLLGNVDLFPYFLWKLKAFLLGSLAFQQTRAFIYFRGPKNITLKKKSLRVRVSIDGVGPLM